MWNTKLTFEECLIEASKYETRTAWYKSNPSSYHRARKQNWLEECCKDMVKITSKHTLESCIESASRSCYYAEKKGWYKECAKHYKK